MEKRKGKNGGTLTPAQSGYNPNPAGKPKGALHSTTRLRRLLGAVQRVENFSTGKTEQFTTLELMDAAQIKKALKGDTAAYREILDRFEGRPITKIEQSGNLELNQPETKSNFDISKLTTDEKRTLLALMRKAQS